MIYRSPNRWTLKTLPHTTDEDTSLGMNLSMALTLHEYLRLAQHYLAPVEAITDLRDALGTAIKNLPGDTMSACPICGKALEWRNNGLWCERCHHKVETCCEGAPQAR